MRRLLPILAMMLTALTIQGQDIRITFTCSMTGNSIEKITATNLTSRVSLTLPGTETLILTQLYPGSTGIPSSDLVNSLKVYPNPFGGTTTLTAVVSEPQKVSVNVQNLNGQSIANTEAWVQAGENAFALSMASQGIYIVSVTTNQGTTGHKIICTQPSAGGNTVRYTGQAPDLGTGTDVSRLKSTTGTYRLYYAPGDIVMYKCCSCNNQSSVIAEKPVASKNIPVSFSDCVDAAGRSYATLQIGDQLWMAENLAYLPTVNPSSEGIGSQPAYYVYGYEDSRVERAKATTNYKRYGVLYNWEAARNSCPEGWRLPDDADWVALEKYLGMTEADALETGLRTSGAVGGKLKETGNHMWQTPNFGARNEIGFTALPGGYRQMPAPGIAGGTGDDHELYGAFSKKGICANFWTATEAGKYSAWSRMLGCSQNGVERGPDNKALGFSVRCIKIKASGNTPPVAAFTTDPENGNTETRFKFDATTSHDAESAIEELEFRWDLEGDGIWDSEYSADPYFGNKFNTAGTYSVILEVKDPEGLTSTATVAVNIVNAAQGTFIDPRDGNTYTYKTIGAQVWMTKNLAWLPAVSPSTAGSDNLPLYYVNGYEGTNLNEAKARSAYSVYGALYNFAAAQTACPAGWHTPSDQEWITLELFLGMPQAHTLLIGNDRGVAQGVGNQLREPGLTHWGGTVNLTSTNSSGFTAFGAGCRDYPQGFLAAPSLAGFFWSSTSVDATRAYDRVLHTDYPGVPRYDELKVAGFSLRCVRN